MRPAFFYGTAAECERVFGPDHPETIQSVANDLEPG